MANINFDTSVTGWTAASGSSTAVPSSISKTMFESMLTGLTPQSDFFDRSIVVNESGTSTYDFRVESDTNTNMLLVDASSNQVGIAGAPANDTGYAITTLANSITTSSTTIDLTDASGFPSSGYAVIGTGASRDSVRWTGKSSNQLTGVTSVSQSHSAGTQVEYKFSYELTVHGNSLFTSDGLGTEVVVKDTSSGGNAALSLEAYSTYAVMDSNGGTSTLGLRDVSVTTNNYFRIANDGTDTAFTITDFNDSNKSVGNTRTPISIDNATGHVGIGGSAATSGYELLVYGNQKIVGDNSGTGTELIITDSSASGAVILEGTTGSYQHIRSTTSGDAEIFLSTTVGTVGSANNSLNIRVNGTSTDFIIYDYDNTNGHSNGDAFLDVDNATTSVGIGGNADTNYQLKVVGDTWAYGKLSIGTSSTIADNPYLLVFSASDTDIISAVSSGSALTASEFGLLVSGDPSGHIVAAVRANDPNDAFVVAVPDTVASGTTNPNCDKSVFRATYNSVIINEDSRDVDFRVESDTNANMLIVDGGLNAVGIGNTPLTGYELTVSGQVLIGTNTLTGTGATDNSTGGTPFDATYGPSGTNPAEVIISQGSNSTGTALLVQSSAANNDSSSIDNATVSIQGNGEPLLQLFDTNGTGNITHIYHTGNQFNIDWSMTNGSTASSDIHNIFRAMSNGNIALHHRATEMTTSQPNDSISFYNDGTAFKVRYVNSSGTVTTATLGTLS